jgi:hypothetical protein
MGRIVKWLVVLSAVGVAVTLASYAGAMLTAGKLLGPAPPLTSRTVQLAFEEVNHMPGDPPAWVFTYQAIGSGLRLANRQAHGDPTSRLGIPSRELPTFSDAVAALPASPDGWIPLADGIGVARSLAIDSGRQRVA